MMISYAAVAAATLVGAIAGAFSPFRPAFADGGHGNVRTVAPGGGHAHDTRGRVVSAAVMAAVFAALSFGFMATPGADLPMLPAVLFAGGALTAAASAPRSHDPSVRSPISLFALSGLAGTVLLTLAAAFASGSLSVSSWEPWSHGLLAAAMFGGIYAIAHVACAHDHIEPQFGFSAADAFSAATLGMVTGTLGGPALSGAIVGGLAAKMLAFLFHLLVLARAGHAHATGADATTTTTDTATGSRSYAFMASHAPFMLAALLVAVLFGGAVYVWIAPAMAPGINPAGPIGDPV